MEGKMGSYNTVEAIVKKGKIYPTEGGKLPEEAKVLLIVLEEGRKKPDTKRLSGLLGSLKTDLDASKWQQEIRSEWDARS
jgi:hypothetical protein